MGQKVSPVGFRIGVIRDWDAIWYAGKNYTTLLHEDLFIRDYIMKKMGNASISRIGIERAANNLRIRIHTAKPGMVIGRGGAEVEELRKVLEERTGKKIHIDIQEIKNPEMDAFLVAENIAGQIARRVAFRRVIKQAAFRTMKAGAKGIKVICAGRLAGSDMARSESHMDGTVPLQTLRADIDYGAVEAHTTYGQIGVKVWIYKGEVIPRKQSVTASRKGGGRRVDAETG